MVEREQSQRVGVGLWEELAANLADKLVCGSLPLLDGGSFADCTKGFAGDQIRTWLCCMAEGITKIDEVAWLRVTDGLRRAGWESYKSGCMRWRLTDERRSELCQFWDVPHAPIKSKIQSRSRAEALT